MLTRPTESQSGQPALPVPEASAAEVIATAQRITRLGPSAEPCSPTPQPDLLRLATALVVDEHPSASSWSAADRGALSAWVAVLIERRGEDGVQHLIRALNRV
ncbi:hypothetical protein GCM10010442_80150 [Kitasatospora kifunensis]